MIFFSPYNPQPPPPIPTKPPGRPTPECLISVNFGPGGFGSVSGPFRVRFGSVSGLFWVRFGSVSGPFRGVRLGSGVGSGRGASVREKNITKSLRKSKPPHEVEDRPTRVLGAWNPHTLITALGPESVSVYPVYKSRGRKNHDSHRHDRI